MVKLAQTSFRNHASKLPKERSVLTSSDFTYLGGFRVPDAAGSWANNTTAYGTGALAFRKVGGSLRFFSIGHVYNGGMVYEMNFPGLSLSANTDITTFPQASVVNAWGDVYTGHHWWDSVNGVSNELSNGVYTYGLYWDEITQTLWWNYAGYYEPSSSSWCVGYSTLGPDGGVATGQAAYKTNVTWKRTPAGCFRLPKYFSDGYLGGGNYLALGAGGIVSAAAPCSSGPALYVIPFPNVETYPDQSSINALELLSYANAGDTNPGTPYTAPLPARRDTRYELAVWGKVHGATSTTIDLGGEGTNPSHYGYWNGVPDRYDPLGSDKGARSSFTITITQSGSPAAGQTRTLMSEVRTSDPTQCIYNIDSPWTTIPSVGDLFHMDCIQSPNASDKDIWDAQNGGNYGSWNPKSGVGYWTMTDYLWQSFCWIDGDNKHGLLYFPTLTTSEMFYAPGGPTCYKQNHQIWIYNPLDLVDVLNKKKQGYEIDPTEQQDFNLTGITYPMNNLQSNEIGGVVFDSSTKTLYLMAKGAWYNGIAYAPAIFAYSVNC